MIINDESLLVAIIDDETTDPQVVANLAELKQETENVPISETCNNNIDNNPDGMITTTSEEQCTPTETLPPTESCGNGIDDNNDGVTDEEQCTPQVSEICGNGIDDNNDGVTDEEQCIVPPTEICDNQIDDDVDGKIDTIDEDCSVFEPTVVIDSAVDEEGEPLSPGDLIAPQEVTFTFSAHGSETSQSFEVKSTQGHQFECALDDESFSSCSSPMTYGMEAGKHDFVVRLVS